MVKKPAETSTRREFLRSCLRTGALAALAGAGVAALTRRRPGPLPGQTCVNQGICRGCGAYAGCGLPQALSAKRAGMDPARGVVKDES